MEYNGTCMSNGWDGHMQYRMHGGDMGISSFGFLSFIQWCHQGLSEN